MAYAVSLVPDAAGVRPWVIATSALATVGAVGCLALSLRRDRRPWERRAGLGLATLALLLGGSWASATVVADELGPFDSPYQPAAVTAAQQPGWQRDIASWPALAADAAHVPSARERRDRRDLRPGERLTSWRPVASSSPSVGSRARCRAPRCGPFIDDVRHRRVVDVLVSVTPLTRNPDMRWVLAHCSVQTGPWRRSARTAGSTGSTSAHPPTPAGDTRSADGGADVRRQVRRQTSRKRRIAMAEPMEPIAMPTMTTTTLVSKTSDPDMCIAVKMLLVVRPLPSWLMKR